MCAHYSDEYYIIGTCTDKTWNSPACPGYCFFRDHIHNTVFRCSADKYCCADGPTCNCTTGINTHDIQDFLPPYAELVGSSVTPNTAVVTSSLFTPIGATSSPLTSTLASTTEISSSASTTSTGLASMTSAVSETTSTPPDPASASGGNNALKIGLGVGISVGAVAVGLLALVLILWRPMRKNSAPFQGPYSVSRDLNKPRNQFPVEMSGGPPQPPAQGVGQRPIYEAPGHEIQLF